MSIKTYSLELDSRQFCKGNGPVTRALISQYFLHPRRPSALWRLLTQGNCQFSLTDAVVCETLAGETTALETGQRLCNTRGRQMTGRDYSGQYKEKDRPDLLTQASKTAFSSVLLVVRSRMTQDGDATSRKGTEKRTAEITSLAKAAISVLARQSAPTPEGLARRLETLSEAFISPEEAHRHDALTKLAQEGVSIEDTIDYVIPATARLMGFRWANDSLSFAEVSIGSARLQETVRGLTTQQRREIVKNRGTILLVVPYPEHHTLGVFVVADQLRRRGYDVHISVSQHARQVAERVKRFKYDMIGVTAAGRRTLASVRDLVEIIKQSVPRITPVIVGGSIIDSGLDTVGITGADFATADIEAALEFCGLTKTDVGPAEALQGTERNDATENR